MTGTPLDIFSPNLFSGRTAVFTGGGSGIGKHVALAFARLGANVVIASRSAEKLDPTADEITRAGAECLAVPTNIRETDAVDALAEQTLERFGAIDFLINNAGGQTPASPSQISDGGWRAVNMTKSLAYYYARHGVTVNALAPCP